MATPGEIVCAKGLLSHPANVTAYAGSGLLLSLNKVKSEAEVLVINVAPDVNWFKSP